MNHGFFEEASILDNVTKLADAKIPCVVVQGRYDVVCPMKSAWDLFRKWPAVELHVIADAGHSAKEDGICSKLVDAADKFRSL